MDPVHEDRYPEIPGSEQAPGPELMPQGPEPRPQDPPQQPGAHYTPWSSPPAPAEATFPQGAPQHPSPHMSPPQPPPPDPERPRGPGWGGVSALVIAGMLLSGGVTLGAVIAYDQVVEPLTASSPAATPQAPSSTEASPVALAPDEVDWSVVADRVAPSVVALQVAGGAGSSQGTGVILDEEGSILTNSHVIGSGGDIQVTLSDGLSYSASVIGSDPTTDIAVIRLDAPPSGLQPASFADSSAVEVGEPVMAAGTPLGLENTVTTGIVSALERPVTTAGEEDDGSDATYTSAIQTDAAINPGNSGGPLVDAAGQVIGINTAIAGIPGAAGQAGSIGLGFAIPADTASMIAEQLSENGSAEHAFLGVTSTDGAHTLGDVTYQGAEVIGVEPNSPAQQAGLEEGDLITALDDIPVGGAAALTGVVRGQPIGSEHTLTVVRDQDEQTLEITLADRP